MDEDYGGDLADEQADRDWERENNKCLNCGRTLDDCVCDENAEY